MPRVRLIPNNRDRLIDTVKLIREFTGQSLKEAKETMELALPFDVPISCPPNTPEGDPNGHTFGELVEKAKPFATIVIGQYPVGGAKDKTHREPIPDDVPPALAALEALAEVRAMRMELAGLRKHLGMLAHE